MLKIFNILAANKQIGELTVQVTDLTAQVEQLKTENENLKQQAAAFTLGSQDFAAEKEALVKSHEEAVKSLIEKHATEVAELLKKIEDAKASAGKEAAQIVAGIGLEPDTIKVEVKEVVKPTAKKGFKVISHLPKK